MDACREKILAMLSGHLTISNADLWPRDVCCISVIYMCDL